MSELKPISIRDYLNNLEAKNDKKLNGINLKCPEADTGENRAVLAIYLAIEGVKVKTKDACFQASSVFLREPYINQNIWYIG